MKSMNQTVNQESTLNGVGYEDPGGQKISTILFTFCLLYGCNTKHNCVLKKILRVCVYLFEKIK